MVLDMVCPSVAKASPIASPMASIRSSNQSKIGHHLRSDFCVLQNAPDVQRCGQREDQTRKNNTGRSKFKATKFSIIEIRGAQFNKEQNYQNGVNNGKNDIVDNRLNLPFGRVPCALDCAGHIAGAGGCCKRRDRHCGDQQRQNHKDKNGFCEISFHGVSSEGRESNDGFGVYVRMIIVCADRTQGSGIYRLMRRDGRSAVSVNLCRPECGFLPLHKV